jgi:hypothetical protein
MPATTLSATITLGPHMTISQLMALMTPQQMLAATSMTFSPGGADVALLQATFFPVTQQVIYTGVITIFPDALPGARNLRIRIQPGGSPPVEFLCPLAFTVETPEERLQRANGTFRSEVAGALQAIRRQAGVPVRMDNFAFTFNGNPPLVVCPVLSGRGPACDAIGSPFSVSVTLEISMVSGAKGDPQMFMIVTEKPCEAPGA